MITVLASVAAALGVVIVVRVAWGARQHWSASPRVARVRNGGSNNAGARCAAAGQPTRRVGPRSMVPVATKRLRSGLQLSLEVVTDAPGCQRRAASSRDDGVHSRVAGHVAQGAGVGQRLC